MSIAFRVKRVDTCRGQSRLCSGLVQFGAKRKFRVKVTGKPKEGTSLRDSAQTGPHK